MRNNINNSHDFRWKVQKIKNMANKYDDLSQKLTYIMMKKHNKRFYSVEKLCCAPPKYMIWLLSTGDLEMEKKYKPIKTPINFDLFLKSIQSYV